MIGDEVLLPIVTVAGAEAIASVCVPNAIDVGETLTLVPTPPSATICGDPDASSLIWRMADRWPVVVGLNATLT